ncbi:VCBS repeat-containing protein, partial [Patescibacteria group bacterium]|nr:VCBS repeat-containing protein [Patescibacteria group bacterium]
MKKTISLLIIVLLAASASAEIPTRDYLQEAWNYTTKEIISDISVGDIDGDGRMEAAVASSSEGVVRAFDGDGSLLWEFSVPTYVYTVLAGDFDGDGRAEVAVGGGSHVYMVDDDGNLSWKYYAGQNNVRVLAKTSKAGIVVGVYSQDCVQNAVFMLNSSGERRWSYNTGYRMPYALAAVDLDADSMDETIVGFIERGVDTVRKSCIPAYTKPSTVLALDETGKQLWESKTPGGVMQVIADDLDADEYSEILAGSSPDILVFNSNGTLLWNQSSVSRVDVIEVGDISGDGKKEVLFGSDNVYNFDRRGSIRWMANTADRVYALAVRDLNGDGTSEVIAGSDALYVFSDLGNRLYKSRILKTVGDADVGDFNGDGFDDVIVGAVLDVILYETGFAAKKSRASAFDQMARDYADRGENASAIEYAKKARAAYLEVGDLDGTSRMLKLIDQLEGKASYDTTTSSTTIFTRPPATVEPAQAKDIAEDAKELILSLSPRQVRDILKSNKAVTVFAVVGLALLVLVLCVIYVIVKIVRRIHHTMKTPTLDK